MKKIELFTGSPRRRGNTSAMAEIFAEEAETAGAAVSETFLYDIDISACIDCRQCLADELICPIADDMQELYTQLDKADVIVIGTPVYWLGPTAVSKLLLDRLRPYFRNRRLEGKTMALLLPAADGEADCDLTIQMFQRAAELLGMNFAGAVTAKAFDIGDAAADDAVKAAVAELVMRLI